MSRNIQPVTGMKDVLQAEIGVWQHVERTAASVLAAYGYGGQVVRFEQGRLARPGDDDLGHLRHQPVWQPRTRVAGARFERRLLAGARMTPDGQLNGRFHRPELPPQGVDRRALPVDEVYRQSVLAGALDAQ